jgi:hypothetical protein
MEDNYTSFKVHSNYYAGILDVIEDLPEAEKNSILAEYFLAFHEYGNTRKIPEFKSKIAQGFFNAILYSVDKSFEKNDNYQASQDIGSVGGKQKAINAKIRAAEKKYQEAEKKLEELEAKAEAKAQQAEQLNTVKTDTPEVEDNQTITNSDTLKTRQLQKKQQPHKPQQVQKEQQLDWQCVAGLELTEHQQQEAIRIRKANNASKKTRTFTQASLKQFLTQVKYSTDAGISIDEVLEVWEGKQWVTWTHSYYAKKLQSNDKPQGISGSQENISFAQSDAVDKSFDKLKSDINFLADNSDAPEGHAEEFTIEDLREIVTKEIQDRQYNKQQQQVLFNKLQAFLISKYPDLARQVKPQQINADIKQIGAVNG